MNRFTVTFVIIPICTIVAACATRAEKEASRIHNTLKATLESAQACYASVNRTEYTARLSQKLAISAPPSLLMLTDQRTATQQDKEDLIARHTANQPCLKITLEGFSKAHPTFVAIEAEAATKIDQIYSELILGSISWGQANQRRMAVITERENRLAATESEVWTNLQAMHTSEIAQRQNAAAALSNWSYQQQQLMQQQRMLNLMNRPRSTSCNWVGNFLNCTTF